MGGIFDPIAAVNPRYRSLMAVVRESLRPMEWEWENMKSFDASLRNVSLKLSEVIASKTDGRDRFWSGLHDDTAWSQVADVLAMIQNLEKEVRGPDNRKPKSAPVYRRKKEFPERYRTIIEEIRPIQRCTIEADCGHCNTTHEHWWIMPPDVFAGSHQMLLCGFCEQPTGVWK